VDDWRTYDAVADTYERVHAPRFAEPARDLVAAVGIGPEQRVLDVGTGTGVAAAAAAEAGARAIGVDRSLPMLAVGRRSPPRRSTSRSGTGTSTPWSGTSCSRTS
jgi:ubiquinone/menaquinone biosynthesis C-methylase UbiE